MKMEDIKYEEGRHYLQTWINALEVLLGWSKQQTLEWAKKWAADLNDKNSLLFHRSEGHYLLNLIIPASLEKQLTITEQNKLSKVLLRVIQTEGSFCYRRPDFDWHVVKPRVDRFLKKTEQFKNKSGGSIEHFLQDYEKRFLTTKIPQAKSKHLRGLLKKTFVSDLVE